MLGFILEPFLLTWLGTRELDGFDGGKSVEDAGRDIFPKLIVGAEIGLQTQGGLAGDP